MEILWFALACVMVFCFLFYKTSTALSLFAIYDSLTFVVTIILIIVSSLALTTFGWWLIEVVL